MNAVYVCVYACIQEWNASVACIKAIYSSHCYHPSISFHILWFLCGSIRSASLIRIIFASNLKHKQKKKRRGKSIVTETLLIGIAIISLNFGISLEVKSVVCVFYKIPTSTHTNTHHFKKKKEKTSQNINISKLFSMKRNYFKNSHCA